MRNDTKAVGFLERRILTEMRVMEGSRTDGYLPVTAAEIEGYCDTSGASVRRAIGRLRDKDLIIPVEEAPDPSNDAHYNLVADRDFDDDGRVRYWTLSPEGAEELSRLNEEYFEDLASLLKRYGRDYSTVKSDLSTGMWGPPRL